MGKGITVVAAMLGLMAAAPAQAAACRDDDGPPRVRVITDQPRPDYRHSLTRSQIGALGGHGHMSSDRRHAGLTQTKTELSVKPTLSYYSTGGGQLCVSLKEVKVYWRMSKFQVDVAAEYPVGSCPYEQILAHENEHVAIALRYFAAADRALRVEMNDAAQRLKPFVTSGTASQSSKMVADRLMAAAGPVVERYGRDSARDNAALDTPESYRAVGARCKNW